MNVVSLCPLPIGVLFWQAPHPLMTVVVKATFSLDRDGEASLAEDQAPLSADRPSAADPDELETASDFAPRKGACDVLLIGGAHADEPSRCIPVSLHVGEIHRRFVALSDAPSTRIPLSSTHLHEGIDASSPEVRVGPESPGSARRRALAAGLLPPVKLDGLGTLRVPLPKDFDFRFFNAAPPGQEVPRIEEDAAIRILGLLPGAPIREARLPGLKPVVFVTDHGLDPRLGGAELEMVCDTLTLDADRATCSLTWRGFIDRRRVPEGTLLVLAAQRKGEIIGWDSVARDLDRGEMTRAIEPPREQRAKLELVVPSKIAGDPPPFSPTSEMDPPTRRIAPRLLDQDGKPTVDLTAIAKTPTATAKPSAAPRPEIPRPPRDEWTATMEIDQIRRPSAPVLPFRAAPPAPETPGTPTSAPMAPVIPVAPPSAPMMPATPSFASVPSVTAVAPSAPTSPILPLSPPASPAPAAPSQPEDDLLPIAAFAAIKAEIWARPGSRLEVLERHGLCEGKWRYQELRHTEALDLEAELGGWERAFLLSAALAQVRGPA